MKLDDILEGLNWATGQNIKHAQRSSRHYQTSGEYVLMSVNIEELFNQTEEFQKLDLTSDKGGGKSMSARIPKAKEHWNSGQHMDPSTVSYNEYTNEFSFVDGRHRLVAAHQLGEKVGQILVPSDQVDIFKKRLGAELII